VKAVRIHEDGGPEVLRYEDVPDPVPGPGEVLISLRAASLNHLDLWIRKGLPSVPKPRILGADGAGVRVDTGERVVINPGLEHGAVITVVGEHTDGTHCELIAVPAGNVFPLDDARREARAGTRMGRRRDRQPRDGRRARRGQGGRRRGRRRRDGR